MSVQTVFAALSGFTVTCALAWNYKYLVYVYKFSRAAVQTFTRPYDNVIVHKNVMEIRCIHQGSPYTLYVPSKKSKRVMMKTSQYTMGKIFGDEIIDEKINLLPGVLSNVNLSDIDVKYMSILRPDGEKEYSEDKLIN